MAQPKLESDERKAKVKVVGTVAVAAISAVAAVASAYFANQGRASEQAATEAVEEVKSLLPRSPIRVFSAGHVNPTGEKVSWAGVGFSVIRNGTGQYTVSLAKPCESSPVVVATTEGGTRGCRALVNKTRPNSFVVETREYDGNGLSDDAFFFVVIDRPTGSGVVASSGR